MQSTISKIIVLPNLFFFLKVNKICSNTESRSTISKIIVSKKIGSKSDNNNTMFVPFIVILQ